MKFRLRLIRLSFFEKKTAGGIVFFPDMIGKECSIFDKVLVPQSDFVCFFKGAFSALVCRRVFRNTNFSLRKVRIMKKVFFALFLLILCAGSAFSAVPVRDITLDKDALCLALGATELLTATVLPVDATDQNVTWESSKSSVASVDGLGNVTAHATGYAMISAKTADGGYTAGCIVYVNPAVRANGVLLNLESLRLEPGQTGTLVYAVTPAAAVCKNVTWESSDPAVASVSKTGEILGKKTGTATIVVTTVDGNFTARCIVHVDEPSIPVTEVILNKKALNLTAGQTETLIATIMPPDATGKHVTWSSSDETIASVSITGEVRAHQPGTARITATTVESVSGSLSDYCDVSVGPASVPVTSVSLDKTAVSLLIGEKFTLSATVLPPGATVKHVLWSSSHPDIASVNITGEVRALSQGIARITVTTVDGSYTAYCDVEVGPIPVASVTIKPILSLKVGQVETLVASVLPEDATNKHVTWSSSDPSVASVGITGEVRAHKTGSTVITVTTQDGNRTATCNVQVSTSEIPVTDVTLNKTALSLTVGAKETLIATVLPAEATGKNVTWSSSDESVASVSVTGEVRALKPGIARITVTTVDGGFTAYCDVEVLNVPVTGVTLDKTTLEIVAGSTSKLHATITPVNAANKAVLWQSNDQTIATVSQAGVVKGIARGKATVSVITNEGNFKADCEVTVVPDTGGATEGCSATAISPLGILLAAPLLLIFRRK